MAEHGKSTLRSGLEIAVVAVLALAAYFYFSPPGPPTLEEYVASSNGRAKVIRSGIIDFKGHSTTCNKAPIVLDDAFEDHAAAWPQTGFIIVNRKYMDPLPKVQQLFTFHHECGHMSGIIKELDADCHGIKTGVRQGWLNEAGLAQLCAFWMPKKGDKVHPPGKVRCENMRRCYKEANKL